VITRTVSLAKYIADLIPYLRNSSSQGIKKRCDCGENCDKQNTTYEAGITIDRDLHYKINNK
jgi:hypothetical protein